jgi:hypothetical protein
MSRDNPIWICALTPPTNTIECDKRNIELNNPEEIKRKWKPGAGTRKARLIVSCMTVHLELSFIVVTLESSRDACSALFVAAH